MVPIMASKELEHAFAEAAKIAGKLPKALQEAGFNRALDEILGGGSLGKLGVRREEPPHGGTGVGNRGHSAFSESSRLMKILL